MESHPETEIVPLELPTRSVRRLEALARLRAMTIDQLVTEMIDTPTDVERLSYAIEKISPSVARLEKWTVEEQRMVEEASETVRDLSSDGSLDDESA